MNCIVLCFVLGHFCNNLRFVHLPSKIQAIKSYKQIESHYNLPRKIFRVSNDIDALSTTWLSDVFMYLDGKKTAAFMTFDIKTGYRKPSFSFLSKKKTKVPFISIFYVSVEKDYRGRGLSSRLFKEAISKIKVSMYLPPSTILALHISPKDDCMSFVCTLYYRLGFRKVLFCTHGPTTYKYNIDYMERESKDLYDLINNPTICNTDGYYLLMYCELKDFGKSYSIPKDALERGNKLFSICKKKKENLEKKNTEL